MYVWLSDVLARVSFPRDTICKSINPQKVPTPTLSTPGIVYLYTSASRSYLAWLPWLVVVVAVADTGYKHSLLTMHIHCKAPQTWQIKPETCYWTCLDFTGISHWPPGSTKNISEEGFQSTRKWIAVLISITGAALPVRGKISPQVSICVRWSRLDQSVRLIAV